MFENMVRETFTKGLRLRSAQCKFLEPDPLVFVTPKKLWQHTAGFINMD